MTDCTVMIGEFSPSGRYLAMMAFGQQSALELWDLASAPARSSPRTTSRGATRPPGRFTPTAASSLSA